MKRYEIYDQDEEGSLRFDLKRILLGLPEEARFDIWKLAELEAVGPDVFALEAKLATNESGILLNWSVLLQLAESFEQVINLRLSGADQPIQQGDGGGRILVLEVFDSTFWSVETNIGAAIFWLQTSFKDVRTVESASV
jgi:hypothetical protein